MSPRPSLDASTADRRSADLVRRLRGAHRGTLSFVSSQAEYTPPVLYSRESRAKLVFLVEARPDLEGAALRPGQPVDVMLSAMSAATWRSTCAA